MQSNAFKRREAKHLYAHVTGVLIVIIFIMGPEGGGPDPQDPLAGSALVTSSVHGGC